MMMALKLAFLSAFVAGASATDPYYSSVTAGQGFSCGILFATKRVKCWGDGALGDSLAALEGKLMNVNHLSISGGGFHVCGLYYDGEERRVNVKAYCVASFEDGAEQDLGQLAIPDLGEGKFWREMSAGGQHTCGIDNDRMVHCWGTEGEDNRRNLGDNAALKHRHISAGGVATCGVLLDRTGYCVGDAPQGELPEVYSAIEFTMLEAGGAFSYGLIKGTNELIKFGPGEAAGDAFLVVDSIPTTPPSGFRSIKTQRIAAGATHVCATGRRNSKNIARGLPAKGAWCAGTGGEEITGISGQA